MASVSVKEIKENVPDNMMNAVFLFAKESCK